MASLRPVTVLSLLILALSTGCNKKALQSDNTDIFPITGPPAVIPPSADTIGLLQSSTQLFALLPKDIESDRDFRFQLTSSRTAYTGVFPVAGNFDGVGGDTVGFFDIRTRTFFLRNTNSGGLHDSRFPLSVSAPVADLFLPIAGDWTRSGRDTVGAFDVATGIFYLRNSNTAGTADISFQFGDPKSLPTPIAGDWDGDGISTVGVYETTTGIFRLRNSNSGGGADIQFQFGPVLAGKYFPIAGDWDGDGKDTVGLYDLINHIVYLRNSNSSGPPDYVIQLEKGNIPWVPLAGNWRGSAAAPESSGYAWPTSTPESQGMDGAKLDAAVAQAETIPYIRSMLVIRHGQLLKETYFHGNRPGVAINIASVSKSIDSALVGIAINDGYLSGVSTPITQLLPAQYFPASPDPRLAQVTMSHLMTMTSGLDSNEDTMLAEMEKTDDWLSYILALPFYANPGTSFRYYTGSTNLGLDVLAAHVPMPLDQYARQKLFDPLGISLRCWHQDISGRFIGGSEMCLTPRDMARFGYLYLHRGNLNGQQIVPAAWVDLSTAALVSAGSAGYYGYWWWHPIKSGPLSDMYRAIGHGGQYIYVIPSLDTIVVFSSTIEVSNGAQEQAQYAGLDDLMTRFILPAFTQ